MEGKTLLGILSVASFVAILFSPSGSFMWVYFLLLGIIFGIWWFKS